MRCKPLGDGLTIYVALGLMDPRAPFRPALRLLRVQKRGRRIWIVTLWASQPGADLARNKNHGRYTKPSGYWVRDHCLCT